MTISSLVEAAHANACLHGFWDDAAEVARADCDSAEIGDLLRRVGAVTDDIPMRPGLRMSTLCLVGMIGMIGEEVGEAIACARSGDFQPRTRRDGKPEGLPSELADIVIRVLDISGALGIDLESAIVGKMLFNAGRKHKHGKLA